MTEEENKTLKRLIMDLGDTVARAELEALGIDPDLTLDPEVQQFKDNLEELMGRYLDAQLAALKKRDEQ